MSQTLAFLAGLQTWHPLKKKKALYKLWFNWCSFSKSDVDGFGIRMPIAVRRLTWNFIKISPKKSVLVESSLNTTTDCQTASYMNPSCQRLNLVFIRDTCIDTQVLIVGPLTTGTMCHALKIQNMYHIPLSMHIHIPRSRDVCQSLTEHIVSRCLWMRLPSAPAGQHIMSVSSPHRRGGLGICLHTKQGWFCCHSTAELILPKHGIPLY